MPRYLRDTPGFASPDDVYEALLAAHAGLTEAESGQFNARLVLILANHIGDADVLREALALAREGLPARGLSR